MKKVKIKVSITDTEVYKELLKNYLSLRQETDALRRDLYTSMRDTAGGCRVCGKWDDECYQGTPECRPVWRGLCKENCEELEENKLRNDSL